MTPRPGAQRVLIVEDEQHLAEGLRFNLAEEGYEVEIVETGEAALDRLLRAHDQPPFDLVVLDVAMARIFSDVPERSTLVRTARGFVDFSLS